MNFDDYKPFINDNKTNNCIHMLNKNCVELIKNTNHKTK